MTVIAILLAAIGPQQQLQTELDGSSRKILQQYAECMAERRTDRAIKFIHLDSTLPLTKEHLELHDPNCMPGFGTQLRARQAQYQFAFAEALLRRDRVEMPTAFSAGALSHPVIAADAPMPPGLSKQGISARDWPSIRAASRVLSAISAAGECIVRADTERSWQLLRTNVASEGERQAAYALSGTASACFRDQGIALGTGNLRGTIALSLYRLTSLNSSRAKN